MQSSSAEVTMMESQNRKRAPAWTEREVRDLIAVWGEESVLSELRSSFRNAKTFVKISKGMKDRGHNRDPKQCHVKLKELRQAYLSMDRMGDPMDTLADLEAAERGPNPEDEVIDEEVELDNNLESIVGSPRRSQELFTTLEVSCQSQQLLFGEQEAGEEMPGYVYTAAALVAQLQHCSCDAVAP
ncbi:hypothetical protein UY3_15780 [Chelonia mydas]|uniref:Myb/SANT-like DNA-binding domain-containing protein n=1 Tax=Chelonia mydas TaxID=8469 RepID=M7API9_CHEMY|nr:hypothetical protein UY3_15780 [Chelonia mydas]